MHAAPSVLLWSSKVIPSQHLTTVTGSSTRKLRFPMRSYRTRAAVRLAIVSLLAVVTVSPCPHAAEAATPAPAVTTPRQLVTEPMTWMVPTLYGYMPAEHVQPTLWIEGQPVTRYTVDRRGAENRLSTAP